MPFGDLILGQKGARDCSFGKSNPLGVHHGWNRWIELCPMVQGIPSRSRARSYLE